MNDQQLAHLSAISSLNEMLRKGTFYISTVTQVADALGATPDAAALRILRPLHCVDIGDMPPELRQALPALIERCVSIPAYQFSITTPDNLSRVRAGAIKLLSRTSP